MTKKLGYAIVLYAVLLISIWASGIALVAQMHKNISVLVVGFGAAFLVGRTYFLHSPSNLLGGLKLAIQFLVLGAIFDAIIFGIAYLAGGVSILETFVIAYSPQVFLLSTILVALGIVLAGHTTHGGALMKRPESKPMKPQQ